MGVFYEAIKLDFLYKKYINMISLLFISIPHD